MEGAQTKQRQEMEEIRILVYYVYEQTNCSISRADKLFTFKVTYLDNLLTHDLSIRVGRRTCTLPQGNLPAQSRLRRLYSLDFDAVVAAVAGLCFRQDWETLELKLANSACQAKNRPQYSSEGSFTPGIRWSNACSLSRCLTGIFVFFFCHGNFSWSDGADWSVWNLGLLPFSSLSKAGKVP